MNEFGFGHHLAKSIGNTGSSPSWYYDWSASESDRRPTTITLNQNAIHDAA